MYVAQLDTRSIERAKGSASFPRTEPEEESRWKKP